MIAHAYIYTYIHSVHIQWECMDMGCSNSMNDCTCIYIYTHTCAVYTYNGNVWTWAVLGSLSAVGVDGDVYALAYDEKGLLYVGGMYICMHVCMYV
jgi:hypothetical protein